MALPDPHPGLVIGYSYLWASETPAAREEGAKDRPCAIVAARRVVEGVVIVSVVPITHAPPHDLDAAIELPLPLKRHLGLDTERSWVVLSEINEFIWPGPDLRPISRARPDTFSYGVLPPKFFARMRDRLLELARRRRLLRVPRSE